MKEPAASESAANGEAVVLSVGRHDVDSIALERILHESGGSLYMKADWTVIRRSTLGSALFVLRDIQIPIALCDGDLVPGAWRKMLEQVCVLPDPPLVIVTSRLADDRLWAEALNLGAYDVLVKPFDATEVIRILSLAWQHWRDRHGVHSNRTKQRTAAAAVR